MESILEKRKIKVEKNVDQNFQLICIKQVQIANFDHKTSFLSDNEM